MNDLSTINGKTPAERRAQIFALQDAMVALPDEQKVDCPVRHHFAAGMYAREMFIPAGTCIVGKIHRHEHLSMLASGTIRIATENGDQTLTGPYLFVSPAGAKNVGVALTDVVFVCFHTNPTDETDLALLEAEHVAPSYEELDLPIIDPSLLEVHQ